MINFVHRKVYFSFVLLLSNLYERTNKQIVTGLYSICVHSTDVRATSMVLAGSKVADAIYFVVGGVILAVGIVASIYIVMTFCRFSSSFSHSRPHSLPNITLYEQNMVDLPPHRKSICYRRLKSNNMKILRNDVNILSSKCVQSRWLYAEDNTNENSKRAIRDKNSNNQKNIYC